MPSKYLCPLVALGVVAAIILLSLFSFDESFPADEKTYIWGGRGKLSVTIIFHKKIREFISRLDAPAPALREKDILNFLKTPFEDFVKKESFPMAWVFIKGVPDPTYNGAFIVYQPPSDTTEKVAYLYEISKQKIIDDIPAVSFKITRTDEAPLLFLDDTRIIGGIETRGKRYLFVICFCRDEYYPGYKLLPYIKSCPRKTDK